MSLWGPPCFCRTPVSLWGPHRIPLYPHGIPMPPGDPYALLGFLHPYSVPCSPHAVSMPVPAPGCPKMMLPLGLQGWGRSPPPRVLPAPHFPTVTPLTWLLGLGPDSLGFLPARGLAGFLLPPDVLDWGQNKGVALTLGVRGGGGVDSPSPSPSRPVDPSGPPRLPSGTVQSS